MSDGVREASDSNQSGHTLIAERWTGLLEDHPELPDSFDGDRWNSVTDGWTSAVKSS